MALLEDNCEKEDELVRRAIRAVMGSHLAHDKRIRRYFHGLAKLGLANVSSGVWHLTALGVDRLDKASYPTWEKAVTMEQPVDTYHN